MIVEKVKYTAQFENGQIVAQWIGIEASPGFEETADQTFQLVQEKIAKWHQQSNPQNVAPAQQGPRGELPTINRAVERLLVLIEAAQSVEELSGYYEKAMENHLSAEWGKKHASLELCRYRTGARGFAGKPCRGP